MSKPLYELVAEYQILQDLLTDEDNAEQFELALSELEGEVMIKAENIGLLIKSLDADVVALNVEIARLVERKRVRENGAARLRRYLQENLPEDKQWDFPRVSIRFQKNPASVVVTNDADVESRFLRVIPESYEINKKAALDYWKETGKVPAGVIIVDDMKRLVVK